MTILFWATYAALWLLTLAIAFAVLLLYRAEAQRLLSTPIRPPEQGPQVGTLAAVVRVEDLEGAHLTVGGPSVTQRVVAFGSPRCKPCKASIEALTAFCKSGPAKNETILFVQADEHATRTFVGEYSPRIRVVSDDRGAVAALYGITSTPYVFVLDASGRVTQKGILGPTQASIAKLVDSARVLAAAES